MPYDSGFSLVALLNALGASAVVLEVAPFLDDRLVSAATERHIQRFLGVVVKFDKAVLADAKANTQGHREIRRAFDLSGAVEN